MTLGHLTTKKRSKELQRERQSGRRCYDHLYIAPLWVSYQANLGTLLRTCDAVGACMAVPRTPFYQEALARGNTLENGAGCIHWVNQVNWLGQQRGKARIIGVELAEDATPLYQLEMARERTIVVLGHEHNGIPLETWELFDEICEIGQIGHGHSLNVAVAGSLVLYKLAGLS